MKIASLLRNQKGKLSSQVRAKPPPVVYDINDLKNNKWHFPDPTKERGTKSHKSSGYINISKIPVLDVEGDFVRTFVRSFHL